MYNSNDRFLEKITVIFYDIKNNCLNVAINKTFVSFFIELTRFSFKDY